MENIKKIFRPLYVPIADWHYRHFRAPQRYHHLYDSIRNLKAERIMEVGVWNGRRAVRMIEAMKDCGVENPAYYGFDLFEALDDKMYTAELSKRPPTKVEVESILNETGAVVNIYAGNTLQTMSKEVSSFPKMDFVFIDGGHSNDTVLSDWKNTELVMDDHTIVIFDDYWHNRTDGGAKLTVDAIDREKYNVEILPEIDRFDNADFGIIEISFAKVTKRIHEE